MGLREEACGEHQRPMQQSALYLGPSLSYFLAYFSRNNLGVKTSRFVIIYYIYIKYISTVELILQHCFSGNQASMQYILRVFKIILVVGKGPVVGKLSLSGQVPLVGEQLLLGYWGFIKNILA